MHKSAFQRSLQTAIVIALGIVTCAVLFTGSAEARNRKGDRFGIRGGIWPQGEVVGRFGVTPVVSGGDTLSIQINEGSQILPFVELFGNFHLGGPWWAEASVGWSARYNVQVYGQPRGDIPILLGDGRIDFFPMFAGIRASKPIGPEARPHDVYLRGGGSLVFANESPSQVYPTLTRYSLYSPGTEGSFGFLLGGGAEYYVGPNVALTTDINYRYTKFSYAREAKFDLSSFWFGAGITIKTK